jgi:hypothetical protein
MDFTWRITKYNPSFRDERGSYTKDEWSSFSDVGSSFDGKEFTIKEYLHTEDLYVNAILEFLDCLKISSLKVSNLEKHADLDISLFRECYSQSMYQLYSTIDEGILLSGNDLENVCRLILREQLWCKLIFDYKMFVHFGYDYYIYVGTSQKCESTIQKIINSGLFVEPFRSPYLDDD